jgi:5-methylcytosine-specific restriction enzyme subunit McrC
VKVPIQNLYYLFCYAWRFLPDDLAFDVGAIRSPDILNLCAHVLTAGIDRLLRRGIDQGYLSHSEETSRLRGRIDITATMTGLTWLHARAVCQFDELTPNTLHNQILRSTVRLLSEAPIEPTLGDRLLGVDSRLSGIDIIPVQASLFKRVQLHRNNGFYAFLLRVCELVHLSLLPDRSGEGSSWFRDVLSDDNYMATVFEEFIRNFYALKQSEFTVGRSQPRWSATAVEPSDLRFLPTMTTDVTLSSSRRKIIIDAKYYREALQANYGSRTVHSDNLYQLLAYLRGSSQSTSPDLSIEGMLVYPVGEQYVNLSYTIDGYPVRIFTLNLGQPWFQIEVDLLKLLAMQGTERSEEVRNPC